VEDHYPERPTISMRHKNALNNSHSLFDKYTVEYIHDEITQLEINNWDL